MGTHKQTARSHSEASVDFVLICNLLPVNMSMSKSTGQKDLMVGETILCSLSRTSDPKKDGLDGPEPHTRVGPFSKCAGRNAQSQFEDPFAAWGNFFRPPTRLPFHGSYHGD